MDAEQQTLPFDKSYALNKQIEELEKKLAPPDAPFLNRVPVSYSVVGLIGLPLAIFVLLFWVRPAFVLVQTKEGDVRDRKKLVRWTLVFALVGYAAVYFYACYTSSTPVVSFSPEILKT